MNYAIVAFGIVLIIAVVQWLVDGRKNYEGPIMDEAMGRGVVEGIASVDSENYATDFPSSKEAEK